MKRVKGTKDTSMIDWSEKFYYNVESPSGLSCSRDIYGGKKYAVLCKRKDDHVGYLPKVKHGEYWSVWYERSCYKAHRIIWELFNGPIPPDKIIDHIDGNKSNNEIGNLRLVSEKQNATNARKYANNTSGVTGVYFDTKTDRKGVGRKYCKVCFQDADGKQHTKSFSIEKLGKEVAFNRAVEYRNASMQLLKDSGLDYTDRHGK